MAVVFLLYANILPNPFVWDDHIFIIHNEYIRDWRNIPLLFQSDFFNYSLKETAFESGGYYRPLVMLVYTFEFLIWGESPFGYHLGSLLLHLANTLLVYTLLLKLFNQKAVALLGSLLFAAHPLQTEAVSYLPSRGDLLSTLFGLGAFLLFLSERRVFRWFSPVLFGMALLSKESAVIFPVLLLGYEMCVGFFRNRERNRIHLAHWGVLTAYFWIRLFYLPMFTVPPEGTVPPFWVRLASIPKLIFAYGRLLLFPHPLHLERSMPLQTAFWDLGTFAWITLLGGLFWFGNRFWKNERLLLFGGIWFLAGMAPVLNIVPLYPSMADHYLYLPSIGLFGMVAFGLHRWFMRLSSEKIKKVFLFLGAGLLIFYGGGVVNRNHDYADELRLFEKTIRYAPQSANLRNNLGAAYMSQGKIEEALRAFQASLALNPRQPRVWANLGTAYREIRDYENALLFIQKAISQDPGQPVFWNKLGLTYAEMEKTQEAEGTFRRALEEDPFYGEGYYNLGVMYWRKGDFQKAKEVWEEGLKKTPDYPMLKRWALPLIQDLSKGN